MGSTLTRRQSRHRKNILSKESRTKTHLGLLGDSSDLSNNNEGERSLGMIMI